MTARDKLKCGCVSDARAWLTLCAEHGAEVAARHAAHAADMAARRIAAEPGQGIALENVAAHDGPAS